MADSIDQALERLLAYPATAATGGDLFVVDVMRRLRRERRRRKLILAGFGGIGAVFGLFGAALLSEPISRLFTDGLPAWGLAQAALFTVGGLCFYLWVMNDDLPLNN